MSAKEVITDENKTKEGSSRNLNSSNSVIICENSDEDYLIGFENNDEGAQVAVNATRRDHPEFDAKDGPCCSYVLLKKYEYLYVVLELSTENSDFKCNVCENYLSSREEMKNHTEEVHKVKTFKCIHCSCLVAFDKFSDHRSMCSIADPFLIPEFKEVNMNKCKYQLILSEKNDEFFLTATGWSETIEDHFCSLCQIYFNEKLNMEAHIFFVHPYKKMECSTCLADCTVKDILEHSSCHGSNSQALAFKMDLTIFCYCLIGSKNFRHLAIEKSEEKSKKIPACKVCKETFNTIAAFKKHVLNKHGSVEFQCPKCVSTVHFNQIERHMYECKIGEKQLGLWRFNLKSKSMASESEEVAKPAKTKAKGLIMNFLSKGIVNNRNIFSVKVSQRCYLKSLFKCLICSENFQEIGDWFSHIEELHDKFKIYTCAQCLLSLQLESFPDHHCARKHNYDALEFRSGRIHSSVILENNTLFIVIEETCCYQRDNYCSVCNIFFAYNDSLRKHLSSKHNKTVFKCVLCSEIIRFELLKDHIISEHQSLEKLENIVSTKIECLEKLPESSPKGYALISFDGLRLVIKNNQKYISYDCNVCECKYDKKSTLLQHLRTTHQLHQFKCVQCNVILSFHNVELHVNIKHVHNEQNTLFLGVDVQGSKVQNYLEQLICFSANSGPAVDVIFKSTTEDRRGHISYECKPCQRCFSSFTFQKHLKIKHKFSIFECAICKALLKIDFLTLHLHLHHIVDPKIVYSFMGKMMITDSLNTIPGRYIFGTVETQVPNFNDDYKHLFCLRIDRELHRNQFECNVCKQLFLAFSSFISHIIEMHFTTNEYFCLICEEVLTLSDINQVLPHVHDQNNVYFIAQNHESNLKMEHIINPPIKKAQPNLKMSKKNISYVITLSETKRLSIYATCKTIDNNECFLCVISRMNKACFHKHLWKHKMRSFVCKDCKFSMNFNSIEGHITSCHEQLSNWMFICEDTDLQTRGQSLFSFVICSTDMVFKPCPDNVKDRLCIQIFKDATNSITNNGCYLCPDEVMRFQDLEDHLKKMHLFKETTCWCFECNLVLSIDDLSSHSHLKEISSSRFITVETRKENSKDIRMIQKVDKLKAISCLKNAPSTKQEFLSIKRVDVSKNLTPQTKKPDDNIKEAVAKLPSSITVKRKLQTSVNDCEHSNNTPKATIIHNTKSSTTTSTQKEIKTNAPDVEPFMEIKTQNSVTSKIESSSAKTTSTKLQSSVGKNDSEYSCKIATATSQLNTKSSTTTSNQKEIKVSSPDVEPSLAIKPSNSVIMKIDKSHIKKPNLVTMRVEKPSDKMTSTNQLNKSSNLDIPIVDLTDKVSDNSKLDKSYEDTTLKMPEQSKVKEDSKLMTTETCDTSGLELNPSTQSSPATIKPHLKILNSRAAQKTKEKIQVRQSRSTSKLDTKISSEVYQTQPTSKSDTKMVSSDSLPSLSKQLSSGLDIIENTSGNEQGLPKTIKKKSTLNPVVRIKRLTLKRKLSDEPIAPGTSKLNLCSSNGKTEKAHSDEHIPEKIARTPLTQGDSSLDRKLNLEVREEKVSREHKKSIDLNKNKRFPVVRLKKVVLDKKHFKSALKESLEVSNNDSSNSNDSEKNFTKAVFNNDHVENTEKENSKTLVSTDKLENKNAKSEKISISKTEVILKNVALKRNLPEEKSKCGLVSHEKQNDEDEIPLKQLYSKTKPKNASSKESPAEKDLTKAFMNNELVGSNAEASSNILPSVSIDFTENEKKISPLHENKSIPGQVVIQEELQTKSGVKSSGLELISPKEKNKPKSLLQANLEISSNVFSGGQNMEDESTKADMNKEIIENNLLASSTIPSTVSIDFTGQSATNEMKISPLHGNHTIPRNVERVIKKVIVKRKLLSVEVKAGKALNVLQRPPKVNLNISNNVLSEEKSVNPIESTTESSKLHGFKMQRTKSSEVASLLVKSVTTLNTETLPSVSLQKVDLLGSVGVLSSSTKQPASTPVGILKKVTLKRKSQTTQKQILQSPKFSSNSLNVEVPAKKKREDPKTEHHKLVHGYHRQLRTILPKTPSSNVCVQRPSTILIHTVDPTGIVRRTEHRFLAAKKNKSTFNPAGTSKKVFIKRMPSKVFNIQAVPAIKKEKEDSNIKEGLTLSSSTMVNQEDKLRSPDSSKDEKEFSNSEKNPVTQSTQRVVLKSKAASNEKCVPTRPKIKLIKTLADVCKESTDLSKGASASVVIHREPSRMEQTKSSPPASKIEATSKSPKETSNIKVLSPRSLTGASNRTLIIKAKSVSTILERSKQILSDINQKSSNITQSNITITKKISEEGSTKNGSVPLTSKQLTPPKFKEHISVVGTPNTLSSSKDPVKKWKVVVPPRTPEVSIKCQNPSAITKIDVVDQSKTSPHKGSNIELKLVSGKLVSCPNPTAPIKIKLVPKKTGESSLISPQSTNPNAKVSFPNLKLKISPTCSKTLKDARVVNSNKDSTTDTRITTSLEIDSSNKTISSSSKTTNESKSSSCSKIVGAAKSSQVNREAIAKDILGIDDQPTIPEVNLIEDMDDIISIPDVEVLDVDKLSSETQEGNSNINSFEIQNEEGSMCSQDDQETLSQDEISLNENSWRSDILDEPDVDICSVDQPSQSEVVILDEEDLPKDPHVDIPSVNEPSTSEASIMKSLESEVPEKQPCLEADVFEVDSTSSSPIVVLDEEEEMASPNAVILIEEDESNQPAIEIEDDPIPSTSRGDALEKDSDTSSGQIKTAGVISVNSKSISSSSKVPAVKRLHPEVEKSKECVEGGSGLPSLPTVVSPPIINRITPPKRMKPNENSPETRFISQNDSLNFILTKRNSEDLLLLATLKNNLNSSQCFYCVICNNVRIPNFEMFKSHLASNHAVINIDHVKCNLCGSFDLLSNFKEHFESHNVSEILQCQLQLITKPSDDLILSFKYLENLSKQRVLIESSRHESLITCEECKMRFMLFDHWIDHLARKHHIIDKRNSFVECCRCQITLKSLTHLDQHVRRRHLRESKIGAFFLFNLLTDFPRNVPQSSRAAIPSKEKPSIKLEMNVLRAANMKLVLGAKQSDISKWNCTICCEVLTNDESFKNHILKKHIHVEKLRCNICLNSVTFSEAPSHFGVHHGRKDLKYCRLLMEEVENEPETIEIDPVENEPETIEIKDEILLSYCCDSKNDDFFITVKMTEAQTFWCKECKSDFDSAEELKEHIDCSHLYVWYLICDTCNRVLSSWDEIESHLEVHGSQKDFKFNLIHKTADPEEIL